MSGQTVLLTGASGAIGRRLALRLQRAGWRVRAAARDPGRRRAELPGMDWYRLDLAGSLDPASLAGCDALVHLAWDTRASDPEAARQTNVEGARRLFAAAREAGVAQVLLVSSMSSHERALSAYGRGKLQVERLLDPERDLAVAPGFVLQEGGVFARLADSLRRALVVPLFYGGRQPIQTIGVDDLCAGIESALEQRERGRLVLAHPQVLAIEQFYRKILALYLGTPRKAMLRLPGAPAFWLLRVAERMHLELPMTSENLLGLKALESRDVTADLRRVHLQPQSCEDVLRELTR